MTDGLLVAGLVGEEIRAGECEIAEGGRKPSSLPASNFLQLKARCVNSQAPAAAGSPRGIQQAARTQSTFYGDVCISGSMAQGF